MRELAKEFKDFISRGNVIDLAVGVIIGGAFGNIVNSLVKDIIMPPVGLLIGGVNFQELKLVLKSASVDAQGAAIPEIAITYGVFLQLVINFVVIAAAVFVMVKTINKLQEQKAKLVREQELATAKKVEKTSEEVKLLREIRDSLKKRG